MHWRVLRIGLSLLVLAAVAGCASKAVVLDPGPVPMPDGASRAEGGHAWSLWVAQARDVRPEGEAGQKLGILYTRFQKNPRGAYLEPSPADYVGEQLSRYLLHRGLEASTSQSARLLLTVDLEQCSVLENPGSVWAEITVRVTYTVHLAEAGGRELGRVRLQGEAQRKSPGDSKRQAEVALRDALADTFDALARSDVFQKAVHGQL
ncbi:MAG: hypothetical protein SCH98_13970 [Deferrisomatales bacterium]|nr:hypothetical protein [Deferrisomatales bacterium]